MAPDDAPEKLSFDNLVIDKQAYDLVIKGKRVDAPPKEIELLYFLASSPNRVFTRAQLLDDVWGFDYFGDTRTVDVHVKRLREKLEGVSDKWELKTVWGVGYKFETKEVSHGQTQFFLQGLCGPSGFDRVAFALAGVVFCYQMSSYALHAKQTELRTTVQSLAEQSKLLEGTDSDVIRQIYMLSIARVAKEDELTVLITDADGNIEMGAKPDGTTYTARLSYLSRSGCGDAQKRQLCVCRVARRAE